MILQEPGHRAGSGRAAAPLSKWQRLRLIAPALVVFGVALGLPSYRLNLPGWGNGSKSSDFEYGLPLAYWTEAIAAEAGWEFVQMARGASPARGIFQLTDSWPILAGATANHLFAFSCLATFLLRLRLAAALAGLSVLAALGCLLPVQYIEWENGWMLGPGYFLWCAAPLVLMRRTGLAATGRLSQADIPAAALSPEDSFDIRRPV